MLGEQRHDLGEDGFAHQLSFLVFGHDAGSHLDLLTHLRHRDIHTEAQLLIHVFLYSANVSAPRVWVASAPQSG